MSIFVFSSTTGAVPIADTTLPYYFLIANLGALAGGFVVAYALDRLGRRPTVTFSYAAAALSMFGCAAASGTGSATAVLIAFTVAAFFATCAWVSAYPSFSELFPTHLRATGIGACVGVGRTGAIIGQVILAATATSFSSPRSSPCSEWWSPSAPITLLRPPLQDDFPLRHRIEAIVAAFA